MDDPVDPERLLCPRPGGVGGVADLGFPARTSPPSGFPRGGAGRGGILAVKGRLGDLDLDIERPRPRSRRYGGGDIERSLAR